MSATQGTLLDGLPVLMTGWTETTAVASVLMRELGAHVQCVATDWPAVANAYLEVDGRTVEAVPPEEVLAALARCRALVCHSEHSAVTTRQDFQKALQDLRPVIPVCTVTAFPEGPWVRRPPLGRSAEAAGGLMWAAHAYGSDRPVYSPRPLAAYGTSLLVVFALQLGLRMAPGSATHPELRVSALAGSLLAQALSAVYPASSALAGLGQPERDRDPLQVNTPTIRCFQASDGWILMAAPSTDAWARAAIAMDRADLAIDERFIGAPWAISNRAARAQLVSEVAATLKAASVDHWLHTFAQVGVPCAPVSTTEQFRGLPHLAQSETVVRSTEGGVLSPRMWKWRESEVRGSRAGHGHWPTSSRPTRLPLMGLRVVELSTFAAGPFGAATLADFGADVIKVEQSHGGDPYREQGLTFSQINRGKRSYQIDLRLAAGRAELEGLIEAADALIINMRRPGLQEFHLEFSDVATVNPKIVYCWVSGWGSGGDLESGAGVDPIFQAVSGLADSNGGYSGEFRLIPSGLLDTYAGMQAAAGVLAALTRRDRTGRAQYLETTLLRSAILAQLGEFMTTTSRPQSLGRDPVGPRALDRIYRADDEWLYLCVTDAAGWQIFTDLLNKPEWISSYPSALDDGYASPLSFALSKEFLTRPRQHWLDTLLGLPSSAIAVPVLRARDLIDDRFAGGGMFTQVEDDLWGQLWELRRMVTVRGVTEHFYSAPLLNAR
jgi:crotonobetainyl-CoA:carnitine CoA-transferase CaiB-like acyl-CoA transferase